MLYAYITVAACEQYNINELNQEKSILSICTPGQDPMATSTYSKDRKQYIIE